MRLSKAFFHTSKEAPHDADIVSHKLLERAGYIKKLSKGLYCYTPLMWKVIKKLMNIIRDELDAIGCEEVNLPLLQPSELWQRTGRWEDFKTAKLLYTLKDREDHEFCLSPTHEEAFVSMVAPWVTSYKQLPINLYQIGTKFRDEIRPRFGLMRGKEFLMKDAYSFSKSPEEMDEQYQLYHKAYCRIFERLHLKYAVVKAHGGKIGKGKSEEFQVLADVGEDLILVAGDYAANVETARAEVPPFSYQGSGKKEQVKTPNISTIEDLSKFLKVPKEHILKTVIYKLVYADKEDFVAIGIRGDREVNDVKVLSKMGAFEILPATEEEIKKVTGCPVGFAGPINSKIPFFADLTTKPMKHFVTAANIEDVHFINVNWDNQPEFDDFLMAKEGDICPENDQKYTAHRGIEVGHIFNLGTKYSEKLDGLYQDEQGNSKPYWMGSYGIGVGRTAQACIEQMHDDKGILWPTELAPYKIFITAANQSDQTQKALAEKIYQELQIFEPILDDRDERVGFKLKDSDLLGIPYKVVIGKSFQANGTLEIESRQGEKTYLKPDELKDWFSNKLQQVR